LKDKKKAEADAAALKAKEMDDFELMDSIIE
jgi:hypothetical protein